ncbi:sulfatase-like hydrolase/transferase [Maribellus maritimus]|uniref:sulfatase-like hydrolase/transferase n=1 Tax=Maribellus maritimus TaxID=2870838 RepID=UPI001EEADE92|nr:sulfatase-like hydrolase/transferase [Maribellus maritimus]MCG6190878.1 sulfatase-like hydrolase/transferase [Maribellus maritimus]
MKTYHPFYILLFVLPFVFSSCKKEKEKLPNIVLIMADDMGYECLGCNGSTEYKTPALDRLATDGIRFENCYSQPLCTPSRVKIMTGKYNYRNYEDFGYLNPNQITFGNILKEAGYSTCIAGKWQLNGLNRNNPGNQDVTRPNHFGFDEYCLWQLNHTRAEGERYANALITQNGVDLSCDVTDCYGPQVFADFVCDFIDRKAKAPFFIYYPMVLVHDPFVPTPDSPEWSDPGRRYEKDTAYYADMMNFTDKIVLQIESKLKEKGVWDNTLFIFTADNGTNRAVISETSYAKVKGGKGLSVNTGNHVPLIVSWPEKTKGNATVDNIISFADFLPTFCDAAGVESSKYKTDGESFYSLLTGEDTEKQNEIFIHYSPRWGTFSHDRWVMDDTYKLYKDGRFFNTSLDTLEKNPLLDMTREERDLKSRFEKILLEKENEIPFVLNDTTFNITY